MNRDQLLIKLRILYQEKNFSELTRLYLMGAWLLNKDDREKIEKIIEVRYKPTTPEQQKLIDFCVKEMGYKIVK